MGKLSWARQTSLTLVAWLASAVILCAQTFTTLHSFDGTDGFDPVSGLTQATDGNLYGLTTAGGSNEVGTLFRVTPNGTFALLHIFSVEEGNTPYGPLIQADDGNFYGTTSIGPDSHGFYGYGTVFKMSPSGVLTTLYTFCSQANCADGAFPMAGLVQGADGNLYGTTVAGGANPCWLLDTPDAGCGTVFRITPGGKLTTLYSFGSQDGDGVNPYAGLVQGVDGAFYGTTYSGGLNNVCVQKYTSSCGTVFKITPSGALTTLHSFCSEPGCADGALPMTGLVQATNGGLYGATIAGANGFAGGGDAGLGDGTLFRISPSGALKTLHSFCSETGCEDGGSSGTLLQASDGNLYGAGGGGANANGEVFELTLGGTFTTAYSFCDPYNDDGCTAGAGAQALIQDTNGRFYATTAYGGTSGACDYDYGCGTAFALGIGLTPFVEARPAAAKVGKAIDILGSSLKGASSVTFNGVGATFTVESPSLIRATVPVGATTGLVQVTTPQRTLKSNVPFRVVR